MPKTSDARLGYAICAEPRSGTNYLCQLLASTDRLGNPRDWLNVGGMRAKGEPDYPAELERQLEMIRTRGCGANGVYGFKLFSVRVDDIACSRWLEGLPNLRFLFLQRDDLLGQAISDVRAEQSGQYRSTASGGGAIAYDRAAIGGRLADIARREARWRRWFARNGITPLRLTYEHVVAGPQQTADAVARWLGIDGEVAIDPARIEVDIQRDDISASWRDRFLRETADLSRLDDDRWPAFQARVQRLRRRLFGRHL